MKFGLNFHAVIKGLITLLTGGLLVFLPGLTLQTAMMIIGAMLLSSGLISLYLQKSINIAGIKIFPIQGVFNIMIGIVFLIAPVALMKIFIVFLGIILVMIGTIQLMGALTTFSRRGWSLLYLLFSLLLLGGGSLLIYNPFKSLNAILTFIGILLIFYGISQIMSLKIRRKTEYYKGSPVEDINHEEV